MERLLYAFVLAIITASFCFGQITLTQNLANTGPIQTGFAVITPLQGGGQGLSVSETLAEQVNGNVFQTSVLPSPLVTLTDVFMNSDPSSGANTGISVVNPNDAAATVTFTLRNQQGVTIGVRTLTVGGRQQISRFVTELFAGVPELSQPMTGLVFINSSVAVGVLGLAFQGPSFTSLPVATQLAANNVISAGTGTPTIGISTTVVTPQTPIFSTGVMTSPVTAPIATSVVSPLPGTITQAPSSIAGIAPTQPIVGSTTPLVNATGGGPVIAAPQIGIGAGGTAALLLPQVVTGGGWTSQIVIANTSATPQLVRVDFFNSTGGPLVLPMGSILPNVLVPAGGFVTLSTR